MSDQAAELPAIVAEDIHVSFLIRYHRSEVTIRGAFVRTLQRFFGGGSHHRTWDQRFWALRGIDLVVRPGDVVGVIGPNGSGKSTLLKTLAGICEADRGRLVVRGTVGCLMSFGVGFRPNLTGRENVFINGSILGLSERSIAQRIDQIIEFSELGDFIDAPVQTYSAGMRSRLGFSIAIHIDPDILMIDEVLSTGDMAFRKKAGNVLDQLKDRRKSIVVASHDMDFVLKTCNRALWLQNGRLQMDGDPASVTRAYAEAAAAARVDQPIA